MKKLSVLFVISILFFTASAHAAGLSAQDKKDLTRIENYMNAMPPTHAEFIQETSDGKTYEGEFWIKRPGRLRFEYKNPSHNFVVADGLFIHFWDAKMKEASDAPIGQTLADFILKDKVTFDDTVKVTRVVRHDGLLEVTLVQSADPGSGDLTLVFENAPLELRAWHVKDATGRVSKVSLMNETTGHFDPELFIFKQPN